MIEHVWLLFYSVCMSLRSFFDACLELFVVPGKVNEPCARKSGSVRICRIFLFVEWERSLPAGPQGGAPCKALND